MASFAANLSYINVILPNFEGYKPASKILSDSIKLGVKLALRSEPVPEVSGLRIR